MSASARWASSLFGFTFYAGLPCLLYAAVKGLVKRSCAQESAPTHLRGLIIQRITAVEISYVD